MFFIPALIGAAASVIGGVAGEAFKAAGRAKQEQLLQAAMDEFGNIDPAKLEEVVAQELGPSAMSKVSTDPRLQGFQDEGLDMYSDIINNGGLDPMARADLNRATTAAARTAGANINRVQQDLDNRGMGSSGLGVVLQAQAGQDASQQAHTSALDAAGGAWQRRMQALGARTQTAGNMRSQDFDEKSRRAQAEDSIARYNADARTAAARYRNQMKQQQWNNQFDIARAKANAATGQGTAARDNAESQGNVVTGVGQTVGNAIVDYSDRSWQAEEREKDRKAGYRPYGGY